MSRRGLGRGLSSIIPTTPVDEAVEVEETPQGLRMLSIDDIGPNPRQPRQVIAPEALAELAASIQEHGLIQPIVVTAALPSDPTPYAIIAGERRWRASRLAGLDEVPVVIKEASPQDMLELALVENIQRSDLNPLEEAVAYQTLMEEFGLTQEQVADRVGKSRTAVANIVRLLRLPNPVKGALIEGQIREGHARAILGLNDDQRMIETTKIVINRGLSVRQTEELVRRLNTPVAEPEPEIDEQPNDPEHSALETRLRQHLGTKVNLFRSRKGGRIVIHYYSEEELSDIYDKLLAEPL
ncbi:MAG: ParB/RepB/Spo0J family partition protein [Caldilineales bacterium]|nr:ParB/RepB/Spo0J family partition protein [Caldilineales bacterium]